MCENRIIVADIKSVFGFGINIGKNKVFYLLTRVRVFADSVSYCFLQ